jgi:Protein of unknown function (DUF3489)
MASREPHEDPMTSSKSKPKIAARSRTAKAAKPKPAMRRLGTAAVAAAVPKARTDTKHAQVIAMLRGPAGTTIAAIMAATGWQQHSVRGFLAGVIRKKLGLNLTSERDENGRIYRIGNGKTSSAADRPKQAA